MNGLSRSTGSALAISGAIVALIGNLLAPRADADDNVELFMQAERRAEARIMWSSAACRHPLTRRYQPTTQHKNQLWIMGLMSSST